MEAEGKIDLGQGKCLISKAEELFLVVNEVEVCRVWPVRCFPLSDPFGAVSICDENGHEVAFIRRLDLLADESRSLMEKHLRRHEFMPVITKILSISPHTPPNTWEVETDHGRTSFELESESFVRRLPLNRILITASNGVRYLILDVKRLDRHSRRLLQHYL